MSYGVGYSARICSTHSSTMWIPLASLKRNTGTEETLWRGGNTAKSVIETFEVLVLRAVQAVQALLLGFYALLVLSGLRP